MLWELLLFNKHWKPHSATAELRVCLRGTSNTTGKLIHASCLAIMELLDQQPIPHPFFHALGSSRLCKGSGHKQQGARFLIQSVFSGSGFE